jgi:hypothetical protein
MGRNVPIRRKLLLLGLTCGFALALAPTAFAADTVSLTRFSKTVTGIAPSGTTLVTVNLLRNTTDVNGNVARQAVDTFTATPGTGGAWTGVFANHDFSTSRDQVEVNYAGSTAPAQVTIGGGSFLPTASSSTAEEIFFSANSIDGGYEVASDGTSMDCGGFCSFTATVNGTALTPSTGSVDFTAAAPAGIGRAATNADAITITETRTGFSFPTTVNLTDNAPGLSPLPIGATAPAFRFMAQASCAAFMDTNEAVCQNLTPGSYTMTQVRGSTTLATQTVTVPAQPNANSSFIPDSGSATFAGLQGGDRLQLAIGTHVLTTLTVRTFTITAATPLGDLLNGANTTVSGTCSPGEFFNTGADVCSATGGVPSPNDLGDSSLSLFNGGGNPIDRTLGQTDDTSSGLTQIDMPELAVTSPQNGEAIHTPFQVLGIERYNDPAALVAAVNAGFPFVGDSPVLTSSVGTSPVLFSYGNVGATAFTTLGNVNVAGGLPLPTLAPGLYADRFTTLDSRGDVAYFDGTFVYQGNATGPSGVSPQGPPAPSCKASATRGLKVTIHGARLTADKKKAKKKKKAAAMTVNCTSSTNGARVAVWLQRGNAIVADGSGVVKRGKVKIKLAGTVKKGSYSLVEVIDAGGLATEATHLVTIH